MALQQVTSNYWFAGTKKHIKERIHRFYQNRIKGHHIYCTAKVGIANFILALLIANPLIFILTTLKANPLIFQNLQAR
jgi:hypothetical protein